MLHHMGWFTKLLKGANHKTSRGQYHGKYGENRIWDNHHSSVDDLMDIEKEDMDCAIALSLSEEDLKGKKVVGDFGSSFSERKSGFMKWSAKVFKNWVE